MTIRQRQYFRFFFHIVAPILFGTVIYALFRGLHFIDPQQKIFPIIQSFQLPEWIKYNLPDGLWFYALLSVILFIWEENFSGHFIAWLVISVIISFFSEFLQAYNLLPGTFDWKDLLTYFIAMILFFLNFQKNLLLSKLQIEKK